jgi:biopolymer transport protein ExbD
MRTAQALITLCTSAFLGLLACGNKAAEEAPPPSGPIVSVLELPVTLRSQGTALADAANVEVSVNEIHVNGQPVLNLTVGVVPEAERQAGGIPKLAKALVAGPHAAVSFAVASGVPYEAVALVLATAKAAGATKIDLQVRAPSGTTAGHFVLDDVAVKPKTNSDANQSFAGLQTRPWSDFVTQWEAVGNACKASPSGSCAYRPEKIADGGDLKIVLHSAGQGVNVEYFRIGPPPEPAEAAAAPEKEKAGKGAKNAKKKPSKKKGKKLEMLDGVPAQKDVVDEALNSPPATEALFQFRAQEATANPSAVTGCIKPVCGTSACGVVVQAEKATSFVRVASLLGAAFPDGTTAPHVVFETP